MSNQPPFDPLNPTAEELADMVRGYQASRRGDVLPVDASIAFEHGFRNGKSDRTGILDDDQRELARRYAEQVRARQ